MDILLTSGNDGAAASVFSNGIRHQRVREFPFEVLKCFEALRCGFNNVVLPLEYRLSVMTGQDTDRVGNFPFLVDLRVAGRWRPAPITRCSRLG